MLVSGKYSLTSFDHFLDKYIDKSVSNIYLKQMPYQHDLKISKKNMKGKFNNVLSKRKNVFFFRNRNIVRPLKRCVTSTQSSDPIKKHATIEVDDEDTTASKKRLLLDSIHFQSIAHELADTVEGSPLKKQCWFK